MNTIDKIVKLGNTTDGRDKSLKAVQYLFKIFITHSATKEGKDYFTPTFNLLRDSRKIFRIGKSFNEFMFIVNKLTNELSFKITVGPLLEVLSKIGYLFYWFFDNLAILTKLKLINLDLAQQSKLAATAWFIGGFIGVIKGLVDLNVLLIEKNKLAGEENKIKEQMSLDSKILKCYLGIMGKIGDLFPAGNASGIAVMLYGKNFSEYLVGLGGLTSALITLYNSWSAMK